MRLRLVARTIEEARRVVAGMFLEELEKEMGPELALVRDGTTGCEGDELAEVHLLAQAAQETLEVLRQRTKDGGDGCSVCRRACEVLGIGAERAEDLITQIEFLRGEVDGERTRAEAAEAKIEELMAHAPELREEGA